MLEWPTGSIRIGPSIDLPYFTETELPYFSPTLASPGQTPPAKDEASRNLGKLFEKLLSKVVNYL